MLFTGNFNDIAVYGKKYDEIWLIVRSLRSMPSGSNIRHVPVLSPSTELFHQYLQWKSAGQWCSDTFSEKYAPRFYQEMKSPEAQKALEELRSKTKEHDILLVCYCQNEQLCHRSLIRPLMNDFCLLISGSDSFSDYEVFRKQTEFLLSKKAGLVPVCIVAEKANKTGQFAERYAKEKGFEFHNSAEVPEAERTATACLYFWDGESRKLQHIINTCKKEKKKLRVFDYKNRKYITAERETK